MKINYSVKEYRLSDDPIVNGDIITPVTPLDGADRMSFAKEKLVPFDGQRFTAIIYQSPLHIYIYKGSCIFRVESFKKIVTT